MGERCERQQAFVLHERAYRETSALIELFTREHGRVGLVARGLRAAKPRFSRGTLRAFQPLECSWLQQNELGQLLAVEAAGLPVTLSGMRLQAALYVNELLMRLLARQDPHPDLFDGYAQMLILLPEDKDALAFMLRRFELRVLAELGYGIEFAFDVSTQLPVVAEGRYRVIPEHGVITAAAAGSDAISGRALLALGGDQVPESSLLREQRQMMRGLLLHHLGGRGLNAWRVLRSPAPPADPA